MKYSELNLLLLYVFVARVDVFADLNFHYITNAPLRPGGELGMDRCPLLHVVCTDRTNFHSSYLIAEIKSGGKLEERGYFHCTFYFFASVIILS